MIALVSPNIKSWTFGKRQKNKPIECLQIHSLHLPVSHCRTKFYMQTQRLI